MLGKRIGKHATIGLISPASAENVDIINKAIENLKQIGFNIKTGKHIYERWGYLAGSDSDRASDLMDMFSDKNVDMVLCVRGGYGSMRILPYIDWNTIQENPKIFAGFSDITTLLNNFAEKCGLITFHSPMGTSNLKDTLTLNSFIDTITNGCNPYLISNPPETPIAFVVEGNAEGILSGGNLSLICSTLGTPYEINTKDKILFIEDVGEEPYKIDRMLTQLILSGKLQECTGIILGQFTECELPHYERSLTLEQIIEDRIIPLGKPTISNLACGHSYPKLTLPIGARIKIDSSKNFVQVLEPVVK